MNNTPKLASDIAENQIVFDAQSVILFYQNFPALAREHIANRIERRTIGLGVIRKEREAFVNGFCDTLASFNPNELFNSAHALKAYYNNHRIGGIAYVKIV